VRVAVLIAFVVPNFITVIAWILLLGPNAGLINVSPARRLRIASAFNNLQQERIDPRPHVQLLSADLFAVTAALDNMDPAYEEAAQMSGASACAARSGSWCRWSCRQSCPRASSCSWRPWVRFGRRRRSATAPAHTLTTKIYELFS